MRRLLVLLAAVAALGAPAAAQAHPLGNFTVNRYSAVELSGDAAYVKYVLDMAEIPTFQERQQITNEAAYEAALTGGIGRGLRLRIGGQTVVLTPLAHELAFPPRSGRAAHAPLRGRLRIASPGRRQVAARVRGHELPRPDRLEGGRRPCRAWRTGLLVDGAVDRVSKELLAYPKDSCSPLEVTGARRRRSSRATAPGSPSGAPLGDALGSGWPCATPATAASRA